MTIEFQEQHEDISFTDLNELNALDSALKAQREYNAINAELKIASKRREHARNRLIAEMEVSGRTDDGNERGKAKLMKSFYNKVTDFDALKGYVYSLNEPVSKYLQEVFIKGNKRQNIPDPLDGLVEKAVEESLASGRSVAECLPPGLEVTQDTSLRIYLRKEKSG